MNLVARRIEIGLTLHALKRYRALWLSFLMNLIIMALLITYFVITHPVYLTGDLIIIPAQGGCFQFLFNDNSMKATRFWNIRSSYELTYLVYEHDEPKYLNSKYSIMESSIKNPWLPTTDKYAMLVLETVRVPCIIQLHRSIWAGITIGQFRARFPLREEWWNANIDSKRIQVFMRPSEPSNFFHPLLPTRVLEEQ
jgi:hypothetical protein